MPDQSPGWKINHQPRISLRARSRKILWRHNTSQPIGGSVIAYAVNGKQYMAVASGMASARGWQTNSTPAKIVVFALP